MIDNNLLNQFKDYVFNREDIRVKRALDAPKPWTSDEILQQYRFCNICRTNDTTTMWIKVNVIDKYQYRASELLPALLALCRWINHTGTLAEIFDRGENFIIEDFRRGLVGTQEIIRKRMNAGLSTWTSAYMIRAESNRNVEWFNWPKERYICEKVVWPVIFMNFANINTIEDATKALASQYGWGKFMAYEVATDLTYAESHLSLAPDLRTWANAGPGAIRGLNRLHGRDLSQSISESRSLAEMIDLLEPLQSAMNSVYRQYAEYKYYYRPSVLRDVEHTLCEFDKYQRVLLGQGRPRQKYNGK